MKTLLILCLSFIFITNANAQTDKVAHFGVGYASAAVTTAILQRYDVKYSFWAGVFVSTALGIGKELYDKSTGKGQAEFNDALATISGGVLGSLTVHISIPLKYKRKSN